LFSIQVFAAQTEQKKSRRTKTVAVIPHIYAVCCVTPMAALALLLRPTSRFPQSDQRRLKFPFLANHRMREFELADQLLNGKGASLPSSPLIPASSAAESKAQPLRIFFPVFRLIALDVRPHGAVSGINRYKGRKNDYNNFANL
jgi:hypothetical protein